MPRVSKKETSTPAPAVPTVPATPTPTVELGSVVKVKHRKTGKTHEVSRAYYEDHKEKLDVV